MPGPWSKPKEYVKEVLGGEDKSYDVYFTNQGNNPKTHPTNVAKRLTKKPGKCVVPGCTRDDVKKQRGLCAEHEKDKEWSKKFPLNEFHTADWAAVILPKKSKLVKVERSTTPDHKFYIGALLEWARKEDSDDRLKRLDGFMFNLVDTLAGNVPDSTSLQEAVEGRPSSVTGIRTPEDLIKTIGNLVERFFPKKEFVEERWDLKNGEGKNDVLKGVGIRTLLWLLALAFACEEANQGDKWLCKKMEEGAKRKSQRTGCWMSLGIYLYMRYTDADQDTIIQCLQRKR